MKRLGILLVLTTLCLSLLPVGSTLAEETPEEIVARYAAFGPVPEAENRGGVFIDDEKFDTFAGAICIKVAFSAREMSGSEENAKVSQGRLLLLRDENGTVKNAPYGTALSTVRQTPVNGPETVTYDPLLMVPDDTLPGYVLVYFNGITAEEWAEMETPPLFFVVRYDGEQSQVLAGPLLAGDLLDQVVAE